MGPGSKAQGFSGCGPLAWSTASIAVASRPSGPAACGIFPDQGLNPWLLHWQMDSLPLSHQGSPFIFLSKRQILQEVLEEVS